MNVSIHVAQAFQRLFYLERGFMTSIKIPQKKPKNQELTAEQKQKNKELSSERILVEHLIRLVKIFRVLKKDFG